MLVYQIQFDPAVQRFDTMAEQARDVQRLLKRFAGYLNWEAKERFDEQAGWAPLAASTLAKYSATRTSAITVQGTVRTSYARNARVALSRTLRTGGVAARENLAELLRLSQGGSALSSVLSGGAGSGSRSVERLRRALIRAGKQRAAGKRASVGGNRRKSERHKLLGRLARSIVRSIDVGAGEATAESRVPWSGVHNQGGKAGHGSVEPQRTFLTIDQDGTIALAEIYLQHVTED